jgi:hypothetical protein
MGPSIRDRPHNAVALERLQLDPGCAGCRRLVLRRCHEPFGALHPHSNLANLGRGWQAVEVVAFCAGALGEVPGVSSLLEPVVNDRSRGGLSMLEPVGSPVEAGLVEGESELESVYRSGQVACLKPLARLGRNTSM